jgi:hypothetical protein
MDTVPGSGYVALDTRSSSDYQDKICSKPQSLVQNTNYNTQERNSHITVLQQPLLETLIF